MKLIKAILACAVLAVTACTEESMNLPMAAGGTSKNAELAAAEKTLVSEARSLSQQTKDIVTRNTVQGAAIGAAAGCGLMLLMGGDANDCMTGAAVGAVAGGGIGYGAGQTAAKANKKLVEQKQVIAKLSGINQKLGSVESRLRSVVRQQNAELASLRRQVSAGQISESAYKARARGINSNRQAVQSSLQKASGQVDGAYKNLVALEKDGAGNLSRSKTAAKSTKSRLSKTIQSIQLVSVN